MTHAAAAAAMLNERVTAKVGESVEGWGVSRRLDGHQKRRAAPKPLLLIG